MNKATGLALGAFIVGVVAIGYRLIFKKEEKVVIKTEAQKRHKIELDKYLNRINLLEADTFAKYYFQLEKTILSAGGGQELVDKVDLQTTFFLSHVNKICQRFTLVAIAEEYPEEVNRLVQNLPDHDRRMCYAMAKGIADCLMDYATNGCSGNPAYEEMATA